MIPCTCEDPPAAGADCPRHGDPALAPPVLVLRCACGAEEPAPVDAAIGDTEDCAACGEEMVVCA